jgi:transcription termination/antitermination protein NusG
MSNDESKKVQDVQSAIHDAQWYVIQTKPTSEDNVRLHLKNANIETFLPKIKQAVRGKKSASSRIKSLFPSYLFAFIDLQDPSMHHMIRYTRGVRKILGDGDKPVPVPEEMISIIKERIGEEGLIEQGLTMKKGDSVRIKGGAFQDLVGILEKPASPAGRVRVLLQIMHHQIKCDLSAADIEKTD